jgi:hypothetical protein
MARHAQRRELNTGVKCGKLARNPQKRSGFQVELSALCVLK